MTHRIRLDVYREDESPNELRRRSGILTIHDDNRDQLHQTATNAARAVYWSILEVSTGRSRSEIGKEGWAGIA